MPLTAKRLKQALRYDQRTGFFFWNEGGFKKRKGARAGCANNELGYWVIGLDSKRYYAHDLAWLYVHGKWAERLEFINGDGFDTRIQNIREPQAMIRLAQSKVCPVCANTFNRNERLSNAQWLTQTYCSKKCVQEHKRREASAALVCKECGGTRHLRVYTTSSGRKSRLHICKRCFNKARNPKRKAKHREKVAASPEKYLYLRTRQNARQRGAPIDMTYDEFLIEIGGKMPEFCPVLGLKLDTAATWNSGCLPTIDRFDSARSYERGNISIISWRANAIKRDGTADEHRRVADWMSAHAGK